MTRFIYMLIYLRINHFLLYSKLNTQRKLFKSFQALVLYYEILLDVTSWNLSWQNGLLKLFKKTLISNVRAIAKRF